MGEVEVDEGKDCTLPPVTVAGGGEMLHTSCCQITLVPVDRDSPSILF